ncbi:hypothetical protein [Rubrimonas cliftonensis]|uniref:NitT/TauT family transport system ATP-binding protein/sulfonate transport system ATP-binding protein n=1 Tax=Rubrimonas cliftonensis TaxID=89524 RepID=A0A1H3VIT5_9RHOB|nr:hypothetical protein [Rubrimonas cliftonensis]SDZ74713.1 NitT/TauT family transport system ATP-binding protein/sulfonate transport system ATP-binding protein [Rubrimonas cliftonensis]
MRQSVEGSTIILVAHDVDEAAFLADRIVVFMRRPARILAEVGFRARLGAEGTLELRGGTDFFALRNELLALVRSTADAEEGGA